MSFPRTLARSLPLQSIRSRILLIALLPALLAEFGMVAYLTSQSLNAESRSLQARADHSVRHLAHVLPDALRRGDLDEIKTQLMAERTLSQLSFARISDSSGRSIVDTGTDRGRGNPDHHFRQQYAITMNGEDGALPAYAEVGISRDQLRTHQRQALMRAALLMLLAILLTGALAWRLSSRLARQLRHVGQVVGRLACGDFTARAQLPLTGEVGALAAGVNEMAEALQTHRSDLEKRIRAATSDIAARKIMAERANLAKSRFFAAASHDLRQPLHALSLFVAALKARNQQPEAETLIENIEASTAAMDILFNALLDISRLDAGTIEAHPVHFPLKKLLEDLDLQFRQLAAEKQLQLRFRPCNVTLYSDPLLLERILVNLLANAIRYTDDGGILVGCRRRGKTIRISVVDTGKGIPPDQQESVFQEFVQLHNMERDRCKGLGLGLAIVSRLGRLLGHRVEVRSELHRGSVFSIDVPLGEHALIQAALPADAPGRLPQDALVLLIDDESAILRGMAELFDNWQIDLVTAHSVSEAMHWLDSLGREPDVIVSDYRLPDDTDGLAVIAQLRQKFGRDIPAILVTGDTAPDSIVRISNAGIPLLHKPLRPAKLRALLTHLIRQAGVPPVG